MATLVALLTNPFFATLLLALGLLLLAFDALVGGLGWLSVVGGVLLALFFWGHTQLGLVGWEALALVALGLGLLAIEALLVPGVGIAGVLGVAALLAGVALSVTGNELTQETIARTGWMLLGVIAILSGGLILLARALPQNRLLRGVVLGAKVGAPEERHTPGPLLRSLGGDRLEPVGTPATSATERLSLVGIGGIACSALRPAGVAELGGRRWAIRRAVAPERVRATIARIGGAWVTAPAAIPISPAIEPAGGHILLGSGAAWWSRWVSAWAAMRASIATASAGKDPTALSALSITASVPSKIAFATSLASARVGRGLRTIDSSICVAVITGTPRQLASAISCFCTVGTCSSGISTPRSPRATITPPTSATAQERRLVQPFGSPLGVRPSSVVRRP